MSVELGLEIAKKVGEHVVIGLGVEGVAEHLRGFFNDARFEEARRKMLDSTILETAQAIDAIRAQAGTASQKAREAYDRAITSEDAARLFHRIIPEATRAVTQEKMRVLASALAALLNPDLDGETKERVAMAIEGLQPSDVVALRQIDANDVLFASSDGEGSAQMLGEHGATNLEALEHAGCVRVNRGTLDSGGVYVSHVGRALLDVLSNWRPLVAPASTQISHPGRSE